MNKIKLRVEVAPGFRIPPGYGIAWRHPAKMAYVCYPIPLNYLFAWPRRAWVRLVRGPTCQGAYDSGWIDGWNARRRLEKNAKDDGHQRED